MPAPASKLFEILGDLSRARIAHSLAITREDTISILAVVPGQRWEIDVDASGNVEIEVFRSDGEILEGDKLHQMIDRFRD